MPVPEVMAQGVVGSGLGRLATLGLSTGVSLALALNADPETFNAPRLGVALAIALLLHLARFPRIVLVRETLLYLLFLAYMLIQLLWTSDLVLARNTLIPAVNFVLVLVLFGSLMRFHDRKAVLTGALLGFLLGALNYTRSSGFPFGYPPDFSYNAVAGMYLFGLLVTLLLASLGRRRLPLMALAAAIMVLIVATTSIKTNLGILLGALVVTVIHLGFATRFLRRNGFLILALAGALAFGVLSSDAMVEAVRRGADRVALGIEILQAREGIAGYSAFEQRAYWQREGLRGWAENPLFGHGVEAFRERFGITAHATTIDLLYNSGLVGFALFYGMLASFLRRLYCARGGPMPETRAILLGGIACYLFISLSGTMHYSAFLAAFVALGTGFLASRQQLRRKRPVSGSRS